MAARSTRTQLAPRFVCLDCLAPSDVAMSEVSSPSAVDRKPMTAQADAVVELHRPTHRDAEELWGLGARYDCACIRVSLTWTFGSYPTPRARAHCSRVHEACAQAEQRDGAQSALPGRCAGSEVCNALFVETWLTRPSRSSRFATQLRKQTPRLQRSSTRMKGQSGALDRLLSLTGTCRT